jgi:hypothetical protein
VGRGDDLPGAVVDRARGLTLPGLASVLPGSARFEEFVATCGTLDRQARADVRVQLTLTEERAREARR